LSPTTQAHVTITRSIKHIRIDNTRTHRGGEFSFPETPVLGRISGKIASAMAEGNQVLWFGNGGSAANAQHLAAEFVGRFQRERSPLRSIAVTTDTSVLLQSALTGFEQIFPDKSKAGVEGGDVAVGISTSSRRSVVLALERANQLGAFTVAFTGGEESAPEQRTQADDQPPRMAAERSAGWRIHQAHILAG